MRRKNFLDKIVALVLVLIAVVSGIQFRFRIPNCGIADLSSVADIQIGTVCLNYASGANGEQITVTDFGTADDPYGVDTAEVIAIVSPTGKIQQSEGSIGQEFVIKERVKGNEIASVGETGYVYRTFGFYEIEGKIEYMNTLNLMNPDSDYLIFMDVSPLNPYTKESVYLLHSSRFGYIKIGTQDTKTLDRNYRSYDFLELKDYEFFSVSESITEVLNQVRKEILLFYEILE